MGRGHKLANNINDLLKRIEKIEQRNKKVEVDKAWESSYARRGLILVFTFIFIGLYMWMIGVSRPFLNAVIPSLGFTLSTLTLPFFKDLWIRWRQNHKL